MTDGTFFASSKILWEIIQPAHALTWLALAGTVLLWWHFAEAGRLIVTIVVITVLVLGIFPVGQGVYNILENRFSNVELPANADGIVVLGGLFTSSRALRDPEESASTSRLRKGLSLMRKYPNAQLYFSGFLPTLSSSSGTPEHELAMQFFKEEGADLSRIHYEKRARNTYENGIYTKALATPEPGQTWLLVTSAYHMPRAVGVFRKIGWNVTPAQTGYKTPVHHSFMPGWLSFNRVAEFNSASREWSGLATYYLTGKTSALFPGP